MNSTISYFNPLFLILGLAWSGCSFSAPVTWQVVFENDSGLSVGGGQFIYDPATTSDCIEYNPIGCDSLPPPFTGVFDGFTVTSELDSISIDLGGLDWGNGTGRPLSGRSWWDDPAVIDPNPGSQQVIRGNFGIGGRWLFMDDPLTQSEVLIMRDFTQNSEMSWEGIWSAHGSASDGRPIALGGGTGAFNATRVVPVPGAIILFFSGLVTFGWKLKKSIDV